MFDKKTNRLQAKWVLGVSEGMVFVEANLADGEELVFVV